MTQQEVKKRKVRIGDVQRRVLTLLAIHKAESTPLGLQRDAGLAVREILAGVHKYVVFGSAQWWPSVYAQLLLEQGQPEAATELIVTSTVRAANVALDEVERRLNEALDTDPQNWRGIEEAFLLQNRLRLLRNLKERLVDFYLKADSLRYSNVTGDGSSLLESGLEFARQVATIVAGISGVAQKIHSYTAELIPFHVGAVCSNRVDVQQASLSRALRVLREHGLIERREGSVLLYEEHASYTETKYYITPEGIARLDRSGLG